MSTLADCILAANPVLQGIVAPAGLSVLNVNRDPEKTTERYKEVNDLEVIDALNAEGWFVKDYKQVKARDVNKQAYKNYLATFSNPTLTKFDGLGEVTLLNSNSKDGTKPWKFNAGFLVALCGNGLVVGESFFETQSVKHVGSIPAQVKRVSELFLDFVPVLHSKITKMLDVELEYAQQLQFARAAGKLRFSDKQEFDPADLLKTHREGDHLRNVWGLFNVVQENIVRGGNEYKIAPNPDATRARRKETRKARSVNNIDLTLKVNQGLWDLAEAFVN